MNPAEGLSPQATSGAHNTWWEGAALSPPRILILSYHFYPSNEIGARRVTALARYLGINGVQVSIVTCADPQTSIRSTAALPGVSIIDVSPPRRAFVSAMVALKRRLVLGRRASVSAVPEASESVHRGEVRKGVRDFYFRLLYFIDGNKRWAWRASRAAVRAGRKMHVDVVIASGPPHSTLLAGAHAARRLRKPFVADLRDPWTDLVQRDSPGRTAELRTLRALERHVMQQAAAVTLTTDAVAFLLRTRYEGLQHRIHVVRNGYDGSPIPIHSETGGRLSILFAGELYVGRDPFPLLSAIEWLLGREDVDAARVEVTFIGQTETYRGKSLRDWAQDKRCASVLHVLGSQPAGEVARAAQQATLLLNLAQKQPLSIPAKTYEQLASGREVLLLCEDDCETAHMVRRIRGVTQVDPDDFEKLKWVILDLYQRHVIAGRLTAPAEGDIAEFARSTTNSTFFAILTSLFQSGAVQKHRSQAAAPSQE